MRVLMVVNNFPWPGDPYNGIFNLRQAHALRELGHEITIFRPVPWSPSWIAARRIYRTEARYEIEGFTVHTAQGFLGPRSLGMGTLRLQHAGRLARIVSEVRPSVVHAHGLLPAGSVALATRRPLIVTAHGSETYRLPYLRPTLLASARMVVRRAHTLVAVSRFVAQHLEAFGATHTEVVYNGADATFYPRDRGEARARFGIDGDRPCVLFVGDLERRKGTFDLIDALGGLDAPPLALFAGSGSAREELERYAHERGVDARFLGHVAHDALPFLYSAADVFTLPSYAEGLPTVLCEAMNVGVPVVATRVGGVAEIVDDGVSGYVVEPADVGALRDRIARLLASNDLAQRLKNAASAFATQNLTWARNALRYDRLYAAASLD